MFSRITPHHGLHVGDEDGDEQLDEDEDESAGSSNAVRRRKGKIGSRKKVNPNSKGVDSLGFEPSSTGDTWVSRSDVDPKFPLTPSTKTAALKALLLKWFKEAPMDKVQSFVVYNCLANADTTI